MPADRTLRAEMAEFTATIIGVPRCPRKGDVKRALRERFGALRADQIEGILKAARQLLQARGAVPFVHDRKVATTAAESLRLYDGVAQDVTQVVGLRNRAQKRADLLRAASCARARESHSGRNAIG